MRIVRNTKEETKTSLSGLVDSLGNIKAEIAALEAKEKEILEELKALGPGERQGRLFEANVFLQSRTRTDWQAVVKEARVPQRVIDKHTESSDITICKVTARK